MSSSLVYLLNITCVENNLYALSVGVLVPMCEVYSCLYTHKTKHFSSEDQTGTAFPVI